MRHTNTRRVEESALIHRSSHEVSISSQVMDHTAFLHFVSCVSEPLAGNRGAPPRGL